MPTYKVKQAIRTESFTGKYGPMQSYMLVLIDEAGNEVPASINQKPSTPEPFGTITGHIETTERGPKFVKEQTFGVTPAPSGASATSGRNDPDTRNEIIRQNSLTNAVAYVLGKASHMTEPEALKYISGKEIVQVATYFAKYSKGEVTVVMNPNEIASAFGYAEQAELPKEEELDLSELPF